MAVVINEFEAVAESGEGAAPAGSNGGPKPRIKPADLRPALSRMARRHARIRAH